MTQECLYNPLKDVQKVEPDGALDLAAAFAKGSVPADLVSSEEDYNGIEDPATISDKPDDVFSGMQMAKTVREHYKNFEKSKE